MKTLRWIDKAVCLGNGKSRIGLGPRKDERLRNRNRL